MLQLRGEKLTSDEWRKSNRSDEWQKAIKSGGRPGVWLVLPVLQFVKKLTLQANGKAPNQLGVQQKT